MRDKMESFYDVSDTAAIYARMVVDMDIYDMMGEHEKLFRSLGVAINEAVGSIFPRRIPVSEDLAESVLNTKFGQELKENISQGYLTVPRFEIPNVGTMFHKVFYPAKLAWNIGFLFLQRTQNFAAIPFIGLKNTVAARIKTYSLLMPWNKVERQKYFEFLEESGYEYGRIIEGNRLPGKLKGKVGGFIDESINFIVSFSEFQNRIESMIGAKYFLESKESADIKISEDDKLRIAAQFSAFINFLGGKGYAPLAQRTTAGRFVYIFTQYPLNQFNVFHEMIKRLKQDPNSIDLWMRLADEGLGSETAHEFLKKIPPARRGKILANMFLMLLAIALPAAYMYALSRSWNVASRALPGLPRITFSDLFLSFTSWLNDPTDENFKAFKNEFKQTFRVESPSRLQDAIEVMKTGILTTRTTGRPIFVDQALDNAIKVFTFGRSSLEEYEKAYPSVLSKLIEGNVEAEQVRKLRAEELERRERETKEAVNLLKLIQSNAPTGEVIARLTRLKQEGKLTDNVREKVATYLKEQATEVSPLERSIAGLTDAQQAKFIWEKVNSDISTDELIALLAEYKKKGLLTENVRAELRKLTQEEGGAGQSLFAQ